MLIAGICPKNRAVMFEMSMLEHVTCIDMRVFRRTVNTQNTLFASPRTRFGWKEYDQTDVILSYKFWPARVGGGAGSNHFVQMT